MTLYATWSSDVTTRYPRVLTDSRAPATLDVAYLNPAEAELHGRLSPRFTTPFSSNNLTVKDLVIDMTVIRAGIFKMEQLEDLQASIDSRIKMLLDGTMIMVTTSGEVATQAQATGMSTVHDYQPVFGMGDIIDAEPDPDRIEAEENAK